ncbi:MAG: Y-family DNA polymerase [Halopseudomonas aestusnigri]
MLSTRSTDHLKTESSDCEDDAGRSEQWVALVDVNNFYASCERVFRPDLEGLSIVVLSNNDGCIIARSQEAKDLGFKMGDLFHMVKSRLHQTGTKVFSSNYALYGDLSDRAVAVYREFTPSLEIYSIDESFLNLTGFGGREELLRLGKSIKERVRQYTGLPVCVGIAPTKTLSKIANRIAKKNKEHQGVFVLSSEDKDRLQQVDISDIWGVSRKLTPKLQALGIYNALDLSRADPKRIRSRFSVVLERMIYELNGQSCLALEEVVPIKKGIMVSRGFGQYQDSLSRVREAIASYATRAGEKMRTQHLAANKLTTFLRTSPHGKDQVYYSNSFSITFPEATSDTGQIIQAAGYCLKKIYRQGLKYQKAGVFLDGLVDASSTQQDFFFKPDIKKSEALMEVLDKLNRDHGRDTVRFAASGMNKDWKMRQKMISPRYTTRWEDIKVIR